MDAGGSIEGIGPPSSVIKAPAVGLAVQKSGRTTAVTTGTVQSINASVSVKYTTSCGGHKGFVISYTNQVVVTPGTFSAGGDSGSLIVTNGGACPQPVALLFAGSSTVTIGNPIGEVLTKTGNALVPAKSISFVSTGCGTSTAAQSQADSLRGQLPGVSELAVAGATAAMRTREREILSRPGVLGIGVGGSAVNSTEAVIKVYVDEFLGGNTRLPRRINGVRVERILTDAFVAY